VRKILELDKEKISELEGGLMRVEQTQREGYSISF